MWVFVCGWVFVWVFVCGCCARERESMCGWVGVGVLCARYIDRLRERERERECVCVSSNVITIKDEDNKCNIRMTLF